MSTRTLVSRHRGAAAVVVTALAVVGAIGAATVVGHDRGAEAFPFAASSNGAAPYGIGEAQAPDLQSEPDVSSDFGHYGSDGDHLHPGEQGADGSIPQVPDRSRHQQRGSTANIDRGVRMRSAPGVVLIETEMTGGEGMGTGMVLTADGQVLTNYHVVEGSERVDVTVGDTGRTFSASLVGADPKRDVALLQLAEADKLATVTVSQASARLGDTVYAVGNGNGQGFLTRLDGKVTGVNQSIDVTQGAMFGPSVQLSNLIETDADVVPGYSGGPLLDAQGHVIGLTTAASLGRSIDGYATPIASAMEVVKQVRNGQESGTVRIGPKGALGVQVATDPQVSGSVVIGLPEGSAAADAGVARGDIITAVDGERVNSAAELATVVGSREPGTEVSVTWRDTAGGSRTATVTLGSSPVN